MNALASLKHEDCVRIEHSAPSRSKVLFVDWDVGNICNFRCSYCPDVLHNGSRPWLDAAAASRFIKILSEHVRRQAKTFHVQFTGGEPTLYPALSSLLKEIGDEGGSAGLISNGSRPIKWWELVVDRLRSVVLSHHIEFVSLNRFLEVAAFLSGRIRTHVNVTMLPSRFDDCVERAKLIREHCPNISMTLKPLRLNFGQALYGYTDRQMRVMESREIVQGPPGEALESVRGAMRVVCRDGTATTVKAADLLLAGANRWRGWHCFAGLELLVVHIDGSIYRGRCRQGGAIGNLRNQSIELPTQPVRCGATSCNCLSDIMTLRCRPTVANG